MRVQRKAAGGDGATGAGGADDAAAVASAAKDAMAAAAAAAGGGASASSLATRLVRVEGELHRQQVKACDAEVKAAEREWRYGQSTR